MLNMITKIKYNKKPSVYSIELKDFIHFRITEPWEYRPSILENYELLFLVSGELNFTFSGAALTLHAGDAIIIPKFSRVRIVTGPAPSCDFYIVSFFNSLETFSEIIGKQVHVQSDKPYLCELFSHLSHAVAENQLQGCLPDVVLVTILGVLLNHSSEEGVSGLNAKDVLEYIDNNIFCPLTLDSVAKHFSYNKDYILKLFRNKYGITVNKYINIKKMNLAKTLLVKSGMTISAVGKSIGFSDAVLFEKFFRYHEKMSPSHYRRMHS